MHGHNYVALFTAVAPHRHQDDLGRVVDFSVLKERLGNWIDQHWDHGFIFWQEDTEMREIFRERHHKCFALPTNPTAENMAAYLLNVVAPELFRNMDLRITKVHLWETENCYAEAKE
jgi:6-pyruvoyltetrahydropterin/6-carboxytetrahydropterin synthase